MTPNVMLMGLNVLVAFLGLAFIALTLLEYTKLSRLREDFESFRGEIRREQDRFHGELRDELLRSEKASQRIITSYGVKDPERKIELIRSALAVYPEVFNGYNALGWAYLEAGQIPRAIDAFKEAIQVHPNMKESYFDLAHAFLKAGDREACVEYLRKAVQVDPSSKTDLLDNELFAELADSKEYQALTR